MPRLLNPSSFPFQPFSISEKARLRRMRAALRHLLRSPEAEKAPRTPQPQRLMPSIKVQSNLQKISSLQNRFVVPVPGEVFKRFQSVFQSVFKRVPTRSKSVFETNERGATRMMQSCFGFILDEKTAKNRRALRARRLLSSYGHDFTAPL